MKKRGPFQERLCNVLEGLKLEKQAYHSRAIVSNVVDELTKSVTIKKLVAVFKPIKTETTDNIMMEFSRDSQEQKFTPC